MKSRQLVNLKATEASLEMPPDDAGLQRSQGVLVDRHDAWPNVEKAPMNLETAHELRQVHSCLGGSSRGSGTFLSATSILRCGLAILHSHFGTTHDEF